MKKLQLLLILLFPAIINASVKAELFTGYKKDSLNLFSIEPYVAFDTCGFKIEFQPDLKFIDTTLPPKRLFKNIVGMNMRTGYISYENDIFRIGAGKKSVRWGEGVSPLLFSGYLPLNNFHYALKYKNIEFSSVNFLLNRIYSTVNDVVGDTSTVKYHFNRYITAHRIKLLFNKTKISLAEAVLIYYKDGETFPLEFLNPLNVLYVLQWNDPDEGNSVPTNVFWDISVEQRFRRHNIYSELLIDDFQYDNPPGDMNEPNHLAFTLGDSFGICGVDVTLEYSLATRWTYGLYAPAGRFTAYGFPIGTEEGNDFDRLYLKINKNMGEMSFGFKGYFKRKGEGSIDAEWPSGGGFSEEEFPANNFLSGTVKYYICPKVIFEYKKERISFNAEIGDLYQVGAGNSINLKAEFIYRFLNYKD